MELLTDLIREIKEDAIINEINIKEKSLALPALKAKWVSRLIEHKNKLNQLERKKKHLIKELIPQVRENMPVKLSDSTIRDTAEGTTEVKNLNLEIDNEKHIVDFLERAEKTISSFSFDISNIIKIMQLETL